MTCATCKHWHFAKMSEEWQCWNDKSIHEGEERSNICPACDKYEKDDDNDIIK